MPKSLRAAVKPVFLFLSLVALAIIGSLATKRLVVNRVSTEGSLEAKKPGSFLEEAQRVGQGMPARGNIQFPNTPQGRMTKLMYGFILETDRRQAELEQGMRSIGWDWVMTPESLRTSENVQECLNRVAKARDLNQKYSQNLKGAWKETLGKMAEEAKGSDEAKTYYFAVRKDAESPGGGLSYTLAISSKLKENHDALETSLRFLLQKKAHYLVDDQGRVTFDASIAIAEREEYDRLVQKIDDTMREVGALLEQRDKTAQDRLRSIQK